MRQFVCVRESVCVCVFACMRVYEFVTVVVSVCKQVCIGVCTCVCWREALLCVVCLCVAPSTQIQFAKGTVKSVPTKEFPSK